MYSGLCLPDRYEAFPCSAFGADVLHRRVAVVDEDLGRAGLDRAVDRSVHLVGEQAPAEFVVGPGRADLLPVDDARRALDVARDE